LRPVICVDLDGTLLDSSGGFLGWDDFGPILPGAKEFMQELHKTADIVIFTCRCTPSVCRPTSPKFVACIISEYLTEHGIPFDDVWYYDGKPVASAYIDDRAVPCVNGDFATALTKCTELLARDT